MYHVRGGSGTTLHYYTDLRTIKHIRGLLVEDDGLPVDVPGLDGGGEGQHQEGAEGGDHVDEEDRCECLQCLQSAE